MNRILSTTAITAMLLAAPAFAEQHTGEGGSMSSDSSNMGSSDIFAQVPSDPQLQFGSDMIGTTIYSTMAAPAGASGEGEAASDASSGEASSDSASSGESSSAESSAGGGASGDMQSIGEINDLVVTQDGQVDYVILGVGGFLGIGERNVAVSMDALEFTQDPQNEGEFLITIPATQEAIENAPEFDRAAVEGSGSGEATSSGGSGSEQSGETMMDNAAEETGQAAEDAGQAAEESTSDSNN